MKKLIAITGSSNNKRTLRIRLVSSENVVKSIDRILTIFEPNNTKFNRYFETYDQDKDKSYLSYKPKDYKDQTMEFFCMRREESGFIIFKEKHIELILLKNSRLFKRLESELFKAFDFVNPAKASKR